MLKVYNQSIDAFDFATGSRRPVRPVSWVTMLAGETGMIVVPVDGLSDRARDRVGF